MNGDVLERAIAALKAHEAWHLNQGEVDGIDLADAYAESTLCNQTTDAIQDLEIELVMLSVDGAPGIPIDYTNYRGVRSIYYITPIRLVRGPSEWHPNAPVLIEAEVAGKGLRTFDPAHIHRWGAYGIDKLAEVERQNADLQAYCVMIRERCMRAERQVGKLRPLLARLWSCVCSLVPSQELGPFLPEVVDALHVPAVDWDEERKEGRLRGRIHKDTEGRL